MKKEEQNVLTFEGNIAATCVSEYIIEHSEEAVELWVNGDFYGEYPTEAEAIAQANAHAILLLTQKKVCQYE